MGEDEEDEEDHISIYEDDATSMQTGTVRHSIIDDKEGYDQFINSELQPSYMPKHLVGTAIKAALGGNMNFQYQEVRPKL